MSAAPPRRAYYNEKDPEKAAWIRELMQAGLVAPGEVDERDIQQVRTDDLKGFCQHHFFAGIAVWSYSLRLAGWPDDRPVWTGSCPCPSFSSAGKGAGFDDPRHLWPEWHRLVREYRPRTILGEQVASAIQHGWLDLVATDLEAEGYAVAAAVLGAHSAGAPHIRQRLYFVADTEHDGCNRPWGAEAITNCDQSGERIPQRDSDLGELADPQHAKRRTEHEINGEPSRRDGFGRSSKAGELGNSKSSDREISVRRRGQEQSPAAPSVLSGFWRDAEWIWCRDQKYRPVRPGTFPLVDGAPARVLRLRGYGDGICAPTAEAFIRAYQETLAAAAGYPVGQERT